LGVQPELGDRRTRLARPRIDRGEQLRRKGLLPCFDLGKHLRLGRQARVYGAGLERTCVFIGRTRIIRLRCWKRLGAKIGFLPIFKLRLALVEVGGDFGDAIPILGNAGFAGGGRRLLARDLRAFACGEDLVDENGQCGPGPYEQHRCGNQRDALLPHGAHAQEADMSVSANENFMVLEQRIEALAPMAQARR